MISHHVVYVDKYHKRGTSIKIYDFFLDWDGDRVTMETDPYMEAKIDIIGPSGYPVVYGDDMSYDEENEGFYYIWKSKNNADTGDYVLEITASPSDGYDSLYSRERITLR